jgi:myo-inositol 2-dehydrogenase/D-chiro-inositol 1-dehydrogenase
MGLGVALIGAGRMGLEHAKNLPSIPSAHPLVVADPHLPSAQQAAQVMKAERVLQDPHEAIEAPGVEVVLIASPTSTHAKLIEHAAQARKAIFCEKPVALDMEETRRVLKVVEASEVPFQIGFQRRFDPAYREAWRRIRSGDVGSIEQFRAVGRDPGLPPMDYLKGSGGIFVDQAIHDLDLARYLVGEVQEVQAWGETFVEPALRELGDVDTTILFVRFRSGALGVIENSRRALYGYDIRTEVFGSKGKLVVDATPKTPLWHYGEHGVQSDHYFFFMDRFAQAYRLELEAFFQALDQGYPPEPGPQEAIASLELALAATESLRRGRAVRL